MKQSSMKYIGGASLLDAANPKAIAASIQQTLLAPGNPLGDAVAKATSITGQLTNVVDKVQKAPETIATAAAEAVDAKIANAGLGTGSPAANTEETGENEYEEEPEEEEEEEEEYENEEEPEENMEGGPYETVYLTKPVKDPLHVFYLNGRPIYFTDNGKGRVKILPLHSGMKMASTASRRKYTKKIKRNKKSRVKSVRKTSKKARRTKKAQRH
jgi:hypothetical protein